MSFLSMRYVFTEVEALTESLKALWYKKFGIRLIAGLFHQTISPIYALNSAKQHKPNTVGRIFA